MAESTQHKLDRVRRPRVQITYDVETLGSIVRTELPFVVGIMADLSGNSIPGATPDANQAVLKDRKFVEIDRDNFNQIMEKVGPKVKLSAETLAVVGSTDPLTFASVDDFDPKNVLDKIAGLRGKFESRTRLSNLVAKLDGDPKLQSDLMNALSQLSAEDKTALKHYVEANLHLNAAPEETGEKKKHTGGSAGKDDSATNKEKKK